MYKFKALILLTTLSACGPLNNSPGAGVRSLGNGLYQISEMGFMGGTVASRAAEYCTSLGNKELTVVGNTTQTGMYSGTSYPVLLFRCEDSVQKASHRSKPRGQKR